MVIRRRDLALALGIALTGCSYPWEDPPSSDPSQPTTVAPGQPTGTSSSRPTSSGNSFCSGTRARFCDDFEGDALSAVWDSVQARSSGTATTQTSSNAPSGSKVLEVANEAVSDPGDASVTQTLSGTSSTLRLRFSLSKQSGGYKPVDVLRITAPQLDGTTSSLFWSLGGLDQSLITQSVDGVVVDSANTGLVPLGSWISVELEIGPTEVGLTVGSTPSRRNTVMAWKPRTGTTELSVGLMSVKTDGGGWVLQLDDVIVD
jgi:hypothetical protein